jgi:hypothetical protein
MEIGMQETGRSQVIALFYFSSSSSCISFVIPASSLPLQVPVLSTQPLVGFSSSLTSLAPISGHTTASHQLLTPERNSSFLPSLTSEFLWHHQFGFLVSSVVSENNFLRSVLSVK